MNNTIAISTTEIRRVGTWALRGLGYPFGTADRAAWMLEHAILSDGHILRLLRLLEADIRASHANPPVCLEKSEAGYALAANGRCLLEVGPTAIDLATSAARRGLPAVVTVANIFGIPFVAGLMDLAVRRGLDIVIAWTSGPGELAALGTTPAGWHAAAAGRQANGASMEGLLTFLDVVGMRHAPWVEAIATRPIGAEQNPQDRQGFLSIHAALANDLTPIQEEPPRERAGPLMSDVEDFMHLYAMERIAWAPTSERSFRQAAF